MNTTNPSNLERYIVNNFGNILEKVFWRLGFMNIKREYGSWCSSTKQNNWQSSWLMMIWDEAWNPYAHDKCKWTSSF